ncbi:MAG: outer membrane protein assembly factor BamD [Bacteroidales bacterium]|nr:outer membrane protein assembly factor BamD [Bacteroidales bacterium]
MKEIKFFLAACLALWAAVSCKSEYQALLEGYDEDAKYAAAFDYFNQGKFSKAAQLFENLSVTAGGTERDDTVQYYWGLSNYRFKDYFTAETNFKEFVEKFPRSPFAEEAGFLRIDCLYSSSLRYELDQSSSVQTISAIGEYLTSYPRTQHLDACRDILKDLGERMDRKAYEGAKLYYKMEDYLAARVALKNVLKDDADNVYREDILYYAAKASYKYAQMSVPEKQRERYLTFIDDYLNFVGEYESSPYRREMDTLYKRAQRALGRYTGPEDGDEDLDAKDAGKERKLLKGAEK